MNTSITNHVLEFSVQGSQTEPYQVTFQKFGNEICATCTCTAGIMGGSCKHRMSILAGDSKAIVSNNKASANTVATWLSGSNIEVLLSELYAAEESLVHAKQNVKTIKKKLDAALNKKQQHLTITDGR